MDYFKLFDFKIEPFSNSPDPRLFYHSKQHNEILQQLEISIRLKRGLNVVIGDIGTGKTTISRQFIQNISNDKAIEYYLILDPWFNSTHAFLTHLFKLLMPESFEPGLDENSLKERIKTHLFSRGIDENINMVLIIDEGQKLSLKSLEVLRELLNFETNDQKLLQIVIFAQNEFDQSLDKVKNFQDRINFRYNLTNLNFRESKQLIQYRLHESFITGKQRSVFSAAAFIAIYRFSKGSPRKIVNLCHQIILSLIIKKKKKAGFFLARYCAKKFFPPKKIKLSFNLTVSIIIACIIFLGGYYSINYVKKNQSSTSEFNPAFNEMITGSKLISENLNSPLKLYPIVKKTPSFHINTEKNEKPEQPVDKIEPDPDIPDSITINSEPPNIYGTIIVPSDTTLFRMIDRVYGDFNPELLNKVLEYNSIISKPDKLLSGIPVRFPVPDKKLKYSDQTIFLLILQTYDFNQAFTKAMLPKYKDLDVRIISFWCQGKGYLFNVVIDRPFTNKENSLIFQKKIKPIIATVPKSVVSLKSIIYDLIEKR